MLLDNFEFINYFILLINNSSKNINKYKKSKDIKIFSNITGAGENYFSFLILLEVYFK